MTTKASPLRWRGPQMYFDSSTYRRHREIEAVVAQLVVRPVMHAFAKRELHQRGGRIAYQPGGRSDIENRRYQSVELSKGMAVLVQIGRGRHALATSSGARYKARLLGAFSTG